MFPGSFIQTSAGAFPSPTVIRGMVLLVCEMLEGEICRTPRYTTPRNRCPDVAFIPNHELAIAHVSSTVPTAIAFHIVNVEGLFQTLII